MGKINSKEKKLLIIFFGVLVFLACYFWGFQKLQAEADALESENETLEKRVAELKIKVEKLRCNFSPFVSHFPVAFSGNVW